MKSTAVIGVILIVMGVMALVYQGVTYTKQESVVNVGPFHAQVERQHTIPLPPIIGFAAVAGGIVLVVIGARDRAVV